MRSAVIHIVQACEDDKAEHSNGGEDNSEYGEDLLSSGIIMHQASTVSKPALDDKAASKRND